MNIQEAILKIKNYKQHLFVSLVIVFVGLASFGLGRLSVESTPKQPISFHFEDTMKENSKTSQAEAVFASKNGSKYYFSNCSGLSRISEQNKVTFSSKEEAEIAGYEVAANCSPLK